MTIVTLMTQIILTIPLTGILLYIQTKDKRKINQLVIPTIYIIILSALFPYIKENIYLIVVFEIFIRNFYISNIADKDAETSNIAFIIESLLSILLSIFTYNYFISKVNTVIPNPEDVKPFIWFIIIIYIINIYKRTTKEIADNNVKKTLSIKKENIIMQFAKYKNMYSNIIKSKNTVINNLTYAIMINNNYKTSKIYRELKSYIGIITKKETSYGIMQIHSDRYLTDEESIKETIKKIEHQLKNTKLNEKEQMEKILKNYTIKEQSDINYIYDCILEFTKK